MVNYMYVRTKRYFYGLLFTSPVDNKNNKRCSVKEKAKRAKLKTLP